MHLKRFLGVLALTHAQHLDWGRHRMVLPPALSPGMVAFTAHNGTATPACILSVGTSVEDGAFNPLVRVGATSGRPACTSRSLPQGADGLLLPAAELCPSIPIHSCSDLQAPGIVVDGVVASPLARWGTVFGNPALPPALDHHVPAIHQALLTTAYLLTRVLGPRLVWRLNQHPLFGA